MQDTLHPSEGPFDGGCACGALRFRLLARPMFVHACHCARCQRETGGPFAHHAMIEFSRFGVLKGEPDFARVPSDSGAVHWVARCPACATALWNCWCSRQSVTRYVRVGTLDQPQLFPPQAHIFVRSKQPWLVLAPGAPQCAAHYDPASTWPAESLQRYAQAKAEHAARRRPKRKPGA